MKTIRISLLLIGLAGTLLFGFAFLLTIHVPNFVETAGKEFIRYQIEKEVRQKIGEIPSAPLEKLAGRLAKKLDQERLTLERQLENRLPEKIAAVVAEMADLSCECRNRFKAGVRQSFEWRLTSLSQARNQLLELMRGKYMEVVEKLTADFRIFTATNGIVFLVLLLVSLLKGRAAAHLLLPASLLLVAVLISGFCYLIQQNWFYTILYNDYVGYGYVAYVGIVYLLLCDVMLNRATVTTALINGALESLGRAASLSPC